LCLPRDNYARQV